MTQDSNRSAQMQWGRQPELPQQAWWQVALTTPGLLAHIVVMLGVCSALTIVNLLAGPRVWWSLAILVIWLALVIVHAIGVGSRSFLFGEDDDAPARPARSQSAEPLGPVVPSWLTLPKRNTTPETSVPQSWALPDDSPTTGWAVSSAPNGEPASVPRPPDEKIPWRAATDIAWLRRPRPAATDDNDPPTSKTASS